MDMYEKFERLLEEYGETASDVARDTGIAKSTFSGWKHKRFVPKKDKMEKIAEHFQLPSDYFYSGTFKSVTGDTMRYEISAGNGRLNDCCGQTNEQNEDGVFFATVVGDSMLPTLMDGDVVRIVETTYVDPSDFAIVRINGEELSVKHCEVTSDGLWVRGENPDAYTDVFYTVQECITLPVQVIGKAISFERKL